MRIDRVGFVLDPNDPRFPTLDQWERMTADERRRVLDALPDEKELNPSEGDWHSDAQRIAVDTLKRHFSGGGSSRSIYVAGNLTTCYPGERPFAPDLLAVLDVPVHPRSLWNVAAEKKGLDFVLEMHWAGNWKKDSVENVARYARLGIREYFLLNIRRSQLSGWRLPEPDARQYEPLLGQHGTFHSEVLDLDLKAENGLVRFGLGANPLLHSSELAAHLERIAEEAQQRVAAEGERAEEAERRAEEEKRRAEEEKRRAEEEKRRADDSSAKLAEALAELERLRKDR